MRFKGNTVPRLVEQAPTSKQLLEMAEISIAASRARSTPAPVAVDTFHFLSNPFDDLATQKESN
jgi:hypothetical protein